MTIKRGPIEERIIAGLVGGLSMRALCAQEGMPDRMTLLRWMADDAEFAARCAHARTLQADALEAQMGDIEEQVLSGEVQADAARVVLSSKQWRAAKLAPKKYGDKMDHTHKGSVTLKIDRLDADL